MMNDIYIKYMNDACVETLKNNTKKVIELVNINPINANWIKKLYSSEIYYEKKFKIKDFSLKLGDNDYKEVDYENSVILYESLKELPRYILTDERFWAWINFEKCYQQALQAMPIKDKESVIKDHYFFNQGSRRGVFFGVMSRCFFRVDLTVDETIEDKYLLTKFVIENPERFRNLSWRSFSNQKHLVLGVLKAEYEAFNKYGELISPGKLYPELAKRVSKIGSVRLIDAITESEIKAMTNKLIYKIYREEGLIE